jgi:metallo-beta-lactamase class B
MKLTALLALGLCSLINPAQAPPAFQADPPKICDDCADWNKPRAPEKVFGNTYYVGTAGLSAVLVTSPAGHILLDGGLPQSAPLIDQNIRTLGFKTAEVRYILTSHGHYDHVGGVAALQRASGAKVAGSASTARALERGENTPDDPQFGFGRVANAFPVVKNVHVVGDGDTIRVGELAVTAYVIPGHAPGSTAWTWRSCEGATCRNVVYADSLTSPSADGFRYSDDPQRVAAFRRSIDTVASLPCDILLAPHPGFAEGKTCRAYADEGRARLEQRLAEERKSR